MLSPYSKEKGSILIWILVAVVLLAGLTTAINQGSRTSTGMLTDQQARLYATEIIQYGDTIRQAVHRMQMRGISEADLSFENNVFSQNDGTLLSRPAHFPNCTTDSCKVFHPEGGGAMAQYPSEGAVLNTENPGTPSAWKAGSWVPRAAFMEGAGTPAAEIAIMLGYVRQEVCRQINVMLGVDNPSGNPPLIPTTTIYEYLTSGRMPATGDDFSDGVMDGQTSYCYEYADRRGTYNYITALIVR